MFTDKHRVFVIPDNATNLNAVTSSLQVKKANREWLPFEFSYEGRNETKELNLGVYFG